MLPLFKVFMSNDVSEVVHTLYSGMITQGKKVEEFETKLKEWFKYDNILTLNSATSGLTLALRLLNLQPDDEVLCTPLTCFATTCAALANRVKIKWVDVDINTCNMDLDDLKNKISEKTKAILFVHWGGFPIDLDRMKEIAGNIPIVEDCAHAFGAEYNGKKIGCHGNIAVFSLQAIKHLTTGDGGLIFLPNKELYERAKLLRWFGIDRERKTTSSDSRLENNIAEWGYKFHMNDINASIGLCNLPYIATNLEIMRRNAEFYDNSLAEVENIKLLHRIPFSRTAAWIYTLRVKNKNDFMAFMFSRGIMVSQVHKRNDINNCVKEFSTKLPNMDKLDGEIVSIPVGWWIDREKAQNVVDVIKEWSTKKHIKIRPLQSSDKTEYLALLQQLNGHVCNPDKFDTVFQQLGTICNVYVLVIGNKILSTIRVIYEPKFSDNVAHIEDVVTDIEYRKYGYGSELIQHAIKEAKTKECYKVVLSCNQENVPFYEKNGFVQKGSEMSLKL